MAMLADILATYRRPRQVLRHHLSAGVREDRALVCLMLGCALVFVAQWPRLARAAAQTPDVPFEAYFGAALVSWLFFMPLVFYGLAALSHLGARALGGQGSWFGARMALFWTLLAVSPLWLVQGLVAGLAGPGWALSVAGILLVVTFGGLWAATLIEAETGMSPEAQAKGA